MFGQSSDTDGSVTKPFGLSIASRDRLRKTRLWFGKHLGAIAKPSYWLINHFPLCVQILDETYSLSSFHLTRYPPLIRAQRNMFLNVIGVKARL